MFEAAKKRMEEREKEQAKREKKKAERRKIAQQKQLEKKKHNSKLYKKAREMAKNKSDINEVQLIFKQLQKENPLTN